MSTHPNVLLILYIKPQGLQRQTYYSILDDSGVNNREYDDISIGEFKYHHQIAESNYLDDYQISTDEGDIVIFDMVTYGYGETISWGELKKQKDSLETWAKKICKEHNCLYEIKISANYW